MTDKTAPFSSAVPAAGTTSASTAEFLPAPAFGPDTHHGGSNGSGDGEQSMEVGIERHDDRAALTAPARFASRRMSPVCPPSRAAPNAQMGPYLGLVPRRDSSRTIDRQLRITKAGDRPMRRLLVGSAHYIIGPFGPDTDLARFGREMAGHGGKAGNKRAAVAVARRLGVLLHRLWVSGETYRPLRTPAQPRARNGKAAVRGGSMTDTSA